MTRRALGAFLSIALGCWARTAGAQDVIVEPPAPAPSQAAPPAPASPPPSAALAPAEEREALNSLYVEILGAALFYSLNYERIFGNFSARVGIGAFSSGGTTWVGIPLTVNFLGIGTKRHIFEVGAGISIQYFNTGSDTLNLNVGAGTPDVLGTVVLGYRMQPPNGGFVFRAGVSPFFGPGVFFPWPYIGLGAAFR